MKRKAILLIFNFSFLILNSFAQAPNWLWAKAMGGESNEVSNGIATDGYGNIYTTGMFSDTADFDPGPSVSNLVAHGTGDVFVSKLDASGNFVWTLQMGGAYASTGESITLDDSRNIYITGFFSGTVDFDPGPGIFNLTPVFGYDVFVCKLDSSGHLKWAKAMGGTGNENGLDIAVDAAGNVFTCGYFFLTADFDPGPGVCSFTAATGNGCCDIFISKLSSMGNFVWARQFGGIPADIAQSITLDAAANVYTTGHFNGTADFDPGIGVFNLVSSSANIFVSKLDSGGNFVFAKSMGGPNGANSSAIALDASGNIITTGRFGGTVDMDPDTGTFFLTCNPVLTDIFVSKLDAAGNFIWAKAMGGSMDEWGYSLAVDASGNIFSTGYFDGTADFDPGPGIFNLTSNGDRDGYISKLDSGGNFQWAKSIGGSGFDESTAITLDPGGHACVTGRFFSTSVVFDFFTLVNSHVQGTTMDFFVSKIDNAIITASNEIHNINASLILSPNPATSEFRIQNSEFKIEKVEIYNVLGEKVYSQQQTTNDKQQTIDVSELVSGIYFVKVHGEKEERVAKFVKQ